MKYLTLTLLLMSLSFSAAATNFDGPAPKPWDPTCLGDHCTFLKNGYIGRVAAPLPLSAYLKIKPQQVKAVKLRPLKVKKQKKMQRWFFPWMETQR